MNLSSSDGPFEGIYFTRFTKVCKFYWNYNCRNGDRCTFAHPIKSRRNLRLMDQHPEKPFQMKICCSKSLGMCKYGEMCGKLHMESDDYEERVEDDLFRMNSVDSIQPVYAHRSVSFNARTSDLRSIHGSVNNNALASYLRRNIHGYVNNNARGSDLRRNIHDSVNNNARGSDLRRNIHGFVNSNARGSDLRRNIHGFVNSNARGSDLRRNIHDSVNNNARGSDLRNIHGSVNNNAPGTDLRNIHHSVSNNALAYDLRNIHGSVSNNAHASDLWNIHGSDLRNIHDLYNARGQAGSASESRNAHTLPQTLARPTGIMRSRNRSNQLHPSTSHYQY